MSGNCEKSVTVDVEKVEGGESSTGNSVQQPTESSPAKSAEAGERITAIFPIFFYVGHLSLIFLVLQM